MAPETLSPRLFEAALELFQARGYSAVTLAEIAVAAGCPLEDLYRHYPRKERFVIKLYERLASDLEARVPELPAGTVGERFAVILRAKLALLRPHREFYRSIFAAALTTRALIVYPGSTSRP